MFCGKKCSLIKPYPCKRFDILINTILTNELKKKKLNGIKENTGVVGYMSNYYIETNCQSMKSLYIYS